MLAAAIAASLALLAPVAPAQEAAALPGAPRTGSLHAIPSVEDAEADLEAAARAHADIAERLDELAEDFELARAHAERLAEELEDADEALARAQRALEEAEGARRAQLREAYMSPGIDLLRRSKAMLLSPDVGAALHASATMGMVARARADVVSQVTRAASGTADNVRNQQGISAGTGAAMEDLRELSVVFSDALEDAAADVAAAEDAVADAEAAREEQAALAAAQQSAQQAAAQSGVVAAQAPGVRQVTITGGTQLMACPLGQPNGFIDSWGFPRSGGRRHQGVDMFAVYGMPIFATADGYVRRVYNNRLGGLSIDLVDALGNRYYYAHLSAAYVTDFQSVRVGQLIAANGNSGNAIATPPHLHWQFHPGDGGPVNPFPLAAALCR